MKNNSTLVKIIALVLTVSSLLCAAALSCFADSWATGNIPSNYANSGYTTVKLSDTGKKATIRIHAYRLPAIGKTGKECNSRLHVTMRTTSGSWLWEGDVDTGSSGKTLTLGSDHSAYRIYLREVSVPGIWYFRTINCYFIPSYWGIECRSNCYI